MVDKTDTTKSALHPLLSTKPARQREFTRRKDAFVIQSIHPADVSKYEADGWTVQREGSRKVRIKKPKLPPITRDSPKSSTQQEPAKPVQPAGATLDDLKDLLPQK